MRNEIVGGCNMKIQLTLPHHAYQLWIETGALSQVGTWVKSLWTPQQIVVITDDTVNDLYGDQVVQAIEKAGFKVSLYAIPAGEQSKSLASAEKIYQFMAEQGMTRKDGVIALGGGVVGDLAGFIASTYMRGIHFLQIPTTLLAQVDSSVGGKTAVNTATAKNLVGTFAQPDGVLIDSNTLQTLEPRRVREGIAEIVKYAAIKSTDLWQLLDSFHDEADLLAHATEVIAACCTIKKEVVQQDELDTGERLQLNFGHTIGHALEQNAGYGVVTHGEGVAIGMVQISQIAEQKQEMPQGTTQLLKEMLEKFHLPTDYADWNEATLFEALSHDKKTNGGSIRIILLEKIGQAKLKKMPIEEMKDYLKK